MKIVVIPAALNELAEAASFYSACGGIELGHALVAEFERAAALLRSSPNLGAVWRNGRRRYGLRRFPYWVIYDVTPNELRIIALAHQRRRPEYWRRRKQALSADACLRRRPAQKAIGR